MLKKSDVLIIDTLENSWFEKVVLMVPHSYRSSCQQSWCNSNLVFSPRGDMKAGLPHNRHVQVMHQSHLQTFRTFFEKFIVEAFYIEQHCVTVILSGLGTLKWNDIFKGSNDQYSPYPISIWIVCHEKYLLFEKMNGSYFLLNVEIAEDDTSAICSNLRNTILADRPLQFLAGLRPYIHSYYISFNSASGT